MESNAIAPPPSNSNATLLASRVVICISEVIFMVVIFTCLFFIYKRCYSRRPRRYPYNLLFVAHQEASIDASVADVAPGPCGLTPAVLKALPVYVYSVDEEGEECAICLSKLMDGEKVRVLPRCEHEFHADCIDMWFHSHATCPVCRAAVGPVAAGNSGEKPGASGRLPLVWSPPVRDRIGSSSLHQVVIQS